MKSTYTSIEPTLIDPKRKPNFQITWETTLKCNLDCTYCSPNDHNNKIPHPPLDECLKTVNFLFEYVDIYMSKKKPDNRHVGLNIFGGESFFHPNIVEILEYIKTQHKKYEHKWSLSIQTVTNAVVKEKVWERASETIGYYTVSYHSESTKEQQDLVRANLLNLKEKKKGFTCSILMHPKHWDNCIEMIEWCKENQIPYLPRQLDHSWHDFKFWYSKEQVAWFDELRGIKRDVPLGKKIISIVNLTSQGRSCCGGTPMHVNRDYTQTQDYIPNNNFKGWHCSVNQFFVFVKQVTKEIFVNKDCQMNFDGKVAPIGTLDDADKIISELKENFNNDSIPVIICNKSKCWCGLCAPKAKTKEEFDSIMENYLVQ